MTKNSQNPRNGITIPFIRPLAEQKELISQLPDLGYTDVWSAEAMGYDGITPLAMAAQWAPSLRLGTAILPVYTRGPALLAQTAATLASLAPGRVVLGIGSSSDIIVERYNAAEFRDPYKKVRDTLRFLKAALSGEKVSEDYDTFEVKGFRLGTEPVTEPLPILVAALREGMLRLAGREGDGAILNWLSPADAKDISGIVKEAAKGAGKKTEPEIVARLFVCPNPDRETVLPQAKRAMAAYLNVPVYRAFHEWRGRGEMLAKHWEMWEAGDRAGSLEVIPDELVDSLFVHGSPEACRERIEQYRAAGIDTPALAVMPFGGIDEWNAVKGLSPVLPSV